MKYLLLSLSMLTTSCTVTSHAVENVAIGRQVSAEQAIAAPAKKVAFTKVLAATWKISLAGLLDLNDAKAVAAKKEDKLEDIDIYFYVIDHPEKGRFLIDTGVSDAVANETDESPIPWMMKSMMGFEHLKTKITAKEFVKTSKKIVGVFMTHLHADHILGLLDLPKDVQIYVGPDEGTFEHFKNMPGQGVTDDFLAGHKTIKQLVFTWAGEELKYIDFFGDGSFVIISSKGHTPGSLAFIAKTNKKTHLIVGDTSHTKWGWENGVTPGDFTLNHEDNRRSLLSLIELAKKNKYQVHLGHQSL